MSIAKSHVQVLVLGSRPGLGTIYDRMLTRLRGLKYLFYTHECITPRHRSCHRFLSMVRTGWPTRAMHWYGNGVWRLSSARPCVADSGRSPPLTDSERPSAGTCSRRRETSSLLFIPYYHTTRWRQQSRLSMRRFAQTPTPTTCARPVSLHLRTRCCHCAAPGQTCARPSLTIAIVYWLECLCTDFWGPASNFGIPLAAVMDTQKDPEM